MCTNKLLSLTPGEDFPLGGLTSTVSCAIINFIWPYFQQFFDDSYGVILPVNLQWKVTFDTHYINKFLIRIHSRTHYQPLEHTKVLCEIVSK